MGASCHIVQLSELPECLWRPPPLLLKCTTYLLALLYCARLSLQLCILSLPACPLLMSFFSFLTMFDAYKDTVVSPSLFEKKPPWRAINKGHPNHFGPPCPEGFSVYRCLPSRLWDWCLVLLEVSVSSHSCVFSPSSIAWWSRSISVASFTESDWRCTTLLPSSKLFPEANVPLFLLVLDELANVRAGPPAFSGAGVVDLAQAYCPGACSTLSCSSSWALPVAPSYILNDIRNHLCKSSFCPHCKYFLQMCRGCFEWLHIASCELELLLQTSSWVTFCILKYCDLFLQPLQCSHIISYNLQFFAAFHQKRFTARLLFSKPAFVIHSFVI